MRGRLNVIGALLVSGLLTVSLFRGAINANTFYAGVEQDWLPQLSTNSVVVMDNATGHKRADIRQLFEQAGHILEYLPTYSPDLNPIERKWAQAKASGVMSVMKLSRLGSGWPWRWLIGK